MAETFKYDVFISHSAKDKPAVFELARRLRKDGLRVWLDDWEIKSGDSYLESRKDGREVFKIKKDRHAEYWQAHEYPGMLVIRTSDGQIR